MHPNSFDAFTRGWSRRRLGLITGMIALLPRWVRAEPESDEAAGACGGGVFCDAPSERCNAWADDPDLAGVQPSCCVVEGYACRDETPCCGRCLSGVCAFLAVPGWSARVVLTDTTVLASPDPDASVVGSIEAGLLVSLVDGSVVNGYVEVQRIDLVGWVLAVVVGNA